MTEEICCITSKGKIAKNKWENDESFFELYSVYKKLGQFIFHNYFETCLNKDTSFLLKVLNKFLSIIKLVLTFMPKTLYGVFLHLFLFHSFSTLLTTLFTIALDK